MPKRVEADAPEAVAPKETTGKPEATGTKKFLLVEKVKKYIAKVNPEFLDNIHQIMEQQVEDEEKNKNIVCFVTFSKKGCKEEDPVDDEVNVEIIKSILLAFHTLDDNSATGKQMSFEVLRPEAETPHILTVQEF